MVYVILGSFKELSFIKATTRGAFVKVRIMAWDVWIHACSHEFLGCGYEFEGFHGCIAMVFFVK